MTQDEALNILKFGYSTYLTGPAGSGKTYVLNKYIQYLRERGVSVAVTASTGIAATHVGGQTIHSWSGIGIKDSISTYDLEALEQKKSLYKRYEGTDVLIIDEISMLGAHQLDMVDTIARHLRRSEKPFGGMQVVFTGDFFQLPPVGYDAGYAYESRVWQETPPLICYLESQYRQNDPGFYSILHDIRTRNVTSATHEKLEGRTGEAPEVGVEATRLFTHNVDVDELNETELEKITGDERTYEMETSGRKSYAANLIKGCLAPEWLTLKVGAKVMFVKNDPSGRFANGTLGTVVELGREAPTVETNDGRRITADPLSWAYEVDGTKRAEITQVPLRLAWAITVHKSQGMTLDAAEVDLSKTFTTGQGYVALSRVRSLDKLYLRGLNERALEVDVRVAYADEVLQRRSQAARERLLSLSREEIDNMQRAFIKKCGGDLNPEKIEENRTEIKKGGKAQRTSTLEQTKALVKEKLPLDDIARMRGVKKSTIIGHLQELATPDGEVDVEYLRADVPFLEEIRGAFNESEDAKLTPIKRALEERGVDVSYDELRLARIFI